MHPNEQLIDKFFTAYKNRDAEGMLACCHNDIKYADPVFGTLEGWRAQAMWRMLCDRGPTLKLTISGITADDGRGSATQEAEYEFAATKRTVHNRIQSDFEFKEGKIAVHHDSYSLWTWAAQALGLKGRLTGWLPPVQKSIRQEATAGLEMYIKRKRLAPKP